MMPRRSGIIWRMMELFHEYKFLRFIRDHPEIEGPKIIAEYRAASGLPVERVDELFAGLIDMKFAQWNGNNHIDVLTQGRKLLEIKMGPISWGLIQAELQNSNAIAAALGAGVVLFFQWLLPLVGRSAMALWTLVVKIHVHL